MYGGSLHNRMRFLVEIVRSIKKYCGNNYPISIKLQLMMIMNPMVLE